jgi:hypothetical protein
MPQACFGCIPALPVPRGFQVIVLGKAKAVEMRVGDTQIEEKRTGFITESGYLTVFFNRILVALLFQMIITFIEQALRVGLRLQIGYCIKSR